MTKTFKIKVFDKVYANCSFLEEIELEACYLPIAEEVEYFKQNGKQKSNKLKVKRIDENKLKAKLLELGFLNIREIKYSHLKRDRIKYFIPIAIIVKLDTEEYNQDITPISEGELKLQSIKSFLSALNYILTKP